MLINFLILSNFIYDPSNHNFINSQKNYFKNLKTKEDYELWLRLAKKNFVFFGINKILTTYQVRNNSLSSKHLNKIKNAFLIYNKFNNFNYMKSLIYVFILYLNAFQKKFF